MALGFFVLDLFAVRGLAVEEVSAGRFLDVDAVVDSAADSEGAGVAREPVRFALYLEFVGAGAWFLIGSTPVPHVSQGHTRKEPAAHIPFTTNLGICFPSHMALSCGLTSRT